MIKIYLQTFYNKFYMEEQKALETLATNIRKLRAINRISQERLAELADLSQQYICSIEKAKVNPSLITILKIAKALGVTINDLAY